MPITIIVPTIVIILDFKADNIQLNYYLSIFDEFLRIFVYFKNDEKNVESV